MAVFAEAKDNNSTFDNSHGDGRDFHSEGELKQTSVTLNNRVKSSTGIRDGSRSGGSVNGNIGELTNQVQFSCAQDGLQEMERN